MELYNYTRGKGKSNHHYYFIFVCPRNLQSTNDTLWEQKWYATVSPDNPTPDPCKQILTHLNHFPPAIQRKHHSALLFIGTNDYKSTLPFRKLMMDIDLMDIIAHNTDKLSTISHFSGNHIDYILFSPDLTACTMASGILPINHHVISDHRTSYCDIDVNVLFSVPRRHIPHITLTSTNIKINGCL